MNAPSLLKSKPGRLADTRWRVLLSIDPLANLAEIQEQLHQRLLETTPVVSEELKAAWEESARRCLDVKAEKEWQPVAPWPEQFLVLITCRDEKHQAEVLGKVMELGWEFRALLG